MVDKYTGQVAYAVMSFGGFLGLGESYHPLPWKVLTYDTRLEGYVIDLDRERLKNAPRYDAGEEPFADPAFGQRLGESMTSKIANASPNLVPIFTLLFLLFQIQREHFTLGRFTN